MFAMQFLERIFKINLQYNIWAYFSDLFSIFCIIGCSSKSFKLYSPKEPPNGSAFPPFHPGAMLDRDVG